MSSIGESAPRREGRAKVTGQARYVVNLGMARPLPPRGGWFGGGSVTLNGAADLMTSPGTSGREASYASVDAYVGRVVAGLGYWRVGVYNLTDRKYWLWSDVRGVLNPGASIDRYTQPGRNYAIQAKVTFLRWSRLAISSSAARPMKSWSNLTKGP